VRNYNIDVIFIGVYGSYVIKYLYALQYQSHTVKLILKIFQSEIPASIHFYLEFASWANVQQYPSLLKLVHLRALHQADIL